MPIDKIMNDRFHDNPNGVITAGETGKTGDQSRADRVPAEGGADGALLDDADLRRERPGAQLEREVLGDRIVDARMRRDA